VSGARGRAIGHEIVQSAHLPVVVVAVNMGAEVLPTAAEEEARMVAAVPPVAGDRSIRLVPQRPAAPSGRLQVCFRAAVVGGELCR
jgi:hypothetical protein